MLCENKIALVTGATRGIGESIALALGQQGAVVIGTATTEAGADKITADFARAGIKGAGIVLDVTQESAVAHALESITAQWGAPLILVNNAGITRDNLLLRMKPEEWDAVINTNLTAVYRLTKACLKAMIKERWGRIISISSLVGASGNPGQSNYAAAKAGLVGFSKALALEVASRNITVNVVAPGLIDTSMSHQLTDQQREQLFSRIPLGRLGKPEEIAAGVIYLASPLAAYVTGETLHINGGMYLA